MFIHLYQPHWFPELRSITWRNYQVWSWLTAAKALQCPISTEADTSHNYLNREHTKLEAAELLGVFKPDVTILDPKVANLSRRIEGKSNCVLLTTV
jgi:hypothetical protein